MMHDPKVEEFQHKLWSSYLRFVRDSMLDHPEPEWYAQVRERFLAGETGGDSPPVRDEEGPNPRIAHIATCLLDLRDDIRKLTRSLAILESDVRAMMNRIPPC